MKIFENAGLVSIERNGFITTTVKVPIKFRLRNDNFEVRFKYR